jgi:hypothetical protein
MSEKISEYSTSVSALASGDLMDVSKLISTSPDVYQSQKLNYSVLLTELNADLTINNLAKTDLTSTTAARSFSLFGNSGGDSLRFRSLAGNPILSLFGSGGVVIGNATTYGALQIYLSALDANGDLYYRNAGGNVTALTIGTAGQVLTVSGGGIPSWASISAPNLGSSNLVSADNARTFTLKSGGTASQNLAFLNSGGGNLLKLSGDKSIDFGSSTNFTTLNIYTDSAANDNIRIFSGLNVWTFFQSQNRNVFLYGKTTNSILLNAQEGIIAGYGVDGGFYALNTSGVRVATLVVEESAGYYFLTNSSGVKKVEFYVAGNQYYMADGCSFGYTNAGSPLAMVDVKGKGATSATTTALFQNSSSVTALKVKDDLYCIFRAKNAVIPDADLANNEMSFYIEEGTNDLHFKVKYSTGTVKSGKINLT